MIMSELLTAVLGFSGLCITYIFTAMVNYILLKDRRWLNYLLIWVVILISETVCFTLLPSQAGFVISFGDVTEYESGALISNFGRILPFDAKDIKQCSRVPTSIIFVSSGCKKDSFHEYKPSTPVSSKK